MAKQIPYGIYCDVGYDRDGNAVSCPWRRYNRQFKTVQCVYLHMLSDRSEDLLWDGCKECNVHLDDDERIVRKIERKQKKSHNGIDTKGGNKYANPHEQRVC